MVCGRAGRIDGPNTWIPNSRDKFSWVQIYLGEDSYLITGMLTQGRTGRKQWVSSYYISYTFEGTWVFPGNYDESSHVMNTIQPPILTRNIKIHPTSFQHSVGMRFDIVGIKSLPDQSSDGHGQTERCVLLHGEKLGVEDGRIEDSSITASSLFDPDQGAFYARLNLEMILGVTPGAWLPNMNDSNPWLKIDLGIDHRVTGVITQGRDSDRSSDYDWTTSFSLSFSKNDVDWEEWEECGSKRVFPANCDQSTAVTSLLSMPVVARLVRIHHITYPQSGDIALRCEVLGYPM